MKATLEEDGKHRTGKLDRCRDGHHALARDRLSHAHGTILKDEGRQTGLLVAAVANAAVSSAPDDDRGVTTRGVRITMPKQHKRMGAVCVAMLAALLTALSFAGSASAKLTKEFARFEFCPYENPEVVRCVHALTDGGEVTLGSKTVPIVNPAVLQGGYNEPPEEDPFGFSEDFFGATNGQTLTKAPQPVPGGLLGLVPPENSPLLVKMLVELAAENGLTGVNSTLEIAGSPSDIKINELALALGEGVTLVLPLKVKLENPLLGNNCYVGSDSNPIVWELRADTTNPPPPNEPITGSGGQVTFIEGGRVVRLADAVIVDNAWAAPAAKGCGGALLAPLIDPVINKQAGLPAPAGMNTAILEGTIHTTTALALKKNNAENP